MQTQTAATTFQAKHRWTVEELQELKLSAIMELFSTLPAPSFYEMSGEYYAHLTDQGHPILNTISRWSINAPFLNGEWMGKAFTPDVSGTSHGYNWFRRAGKTLRKYRMRTDIAPSRFDGRDAFQLTYNAYSSLMGRVQMVDELRRVQDGLYLGVGTFGFTEKQRMRPLPFVLSGPVGPFVGPDKDEAR